MTDDEAAAIRLLINTIGIELRKSQGVTDPNKEERWYILWPGDSSDYLSPEEMRLLPILKEWLPEWK